MTQPTIAQLHNLTDRAASGLTVDEQQRLRDGLARLDRAEAERDELRKRLRLAHQARRAKEHQLDGIRRALCDIGAIQDDDPYSHADLEDVIRQIGRLDEEQPADTTCTSSCDSVPGIRGLLEHVGIDTSRRDITVAGRVVDAAEPGPAATQATEPAGWLHAGTRDLSITDTTKEN